MFQRGAAEARPALLFWGGGPGVVGGGVQPPSPTPPPSGGADFTEAPKALKKIFWSKVIGAGENFSSAEGLEEDLAQVLFWGGGG